MHEGKQIIFLAIQSGMIFCPGSTLMASSPKGATHGWLSMIGEPPWMPTCWTIPALMVHIHGHDEPLAPLLAMVAPAVVPCQWSLVWLHQMEGILGHPLELGPLGILHPWVGVHPMPAEVEPKQIHGL